MPPTLTPDQQQILDRAMTRFCASEKARKRHEQKWNRNYALYRGWNDWNRNTTRTERDRDLTLPPEGREWGADLVIRVIFSIIETLVPKMVIHRPRMLVLPRDDTAARNVRNMKSLLDWQQQQINYELVLQTAAKDGLLYGLGITKAWWETQRVQGEPYIAPRLPTQENPAKWGVSQKDTVIFDDPKAESVDPFDFYWDDFGYSMDTIGHCTQRMWMTDQDVMQRIESGEWCNQDPQRGPILPQLSAEDISGMGTANKRDEAWGERVKAQNNGRAVGDANMSRVHEVLIHQDGQKTREHPRGCVTVILDRLAPVAYGNYPYWHAKYPFQICRPTEDTHQFVGISEPENLEDYQEELSTLRGQRRDAASMALNSPLAFQEGLVETDDVKWAPNALIPVNGDPNELIKQFQIRDVPASGYQEEAAINRDIEVTSGISDAVRGADPGGQSTSATATGAMLLSASANARVELKTLRCEVELISPCAYQWMRLNQQKILSEKEIPLPARPDPENPGEMVWATKVLTPDELAGTFAAVPVGGSTAPENVPQKRQDGQQKWTMFGGNPHVDQRLLTLDVMDDMGVAQPEALLTPPQPGVPPGVLENLKAFGVSEEDIQLAVQMAQQAQDAASAQDTGAGQQPQPAMNGNGNGTG